MRKEPSPKALAVAAQAWTDGETAKTVMDPALATAFARRVDVLLDVAADLWAVLANVSGGDWAKQGPKWRAAARRARDRYQSMLLALPPERTT